MESCASCLFNFIIIGEPLKPSFLGPNSWKFESYWSGHQRGWDDQLCAVIVVESLSWNFALLYCKRSSLPSMFTSGSVLKHLSNPWKYLLHFLFRKTAILWNLPTETFFLKEENEYSKTIYVHIDLTLPHDEQDATQGQF